MERHLRDPSLRQEWVTPMFDLIAPRYDDFTRAFSFGMDRRWKAALVDRAVSAVRQDALAIDVATGTGDLAFALGRARGDVAVVGLDVSARMLALAGSRGRLEGTVSLAGGDLSRLPLRTSSVDAVTAGYALRNTPDWRGSVQELARVLRPGGHLLTLDFYLPAGTAWRAAFLGWLAAAGRLVGWWWHREPLAYGYIARSIELFTTAAGFSAELDAAGFAVLAVERRLGGGIAIHHARRR